MKLGYNNFPPKYKNVKTMNIKLNLIDNPEYKYKIDQHVLLDIKYLIMRLSKTLVKAHSKLSLKRD